VKTIPELIEAGELTSFILKGSKNIDRIRQETMDICNTLMGIMMSICKKNSNFDPVKELRWDAVNSVENRVVGTWIIFRPRTNRIAEVSTGDISIGDFAITYIDIDTEYNPNDTPFMATPGTVSSKMVYSEQIHACLPSLVAGIEARFQFLKNDYGAAILRAADYENSYF
jgi:hypothetical protein